MGLREYIIRRIITTLILIWGVLTINFLLFNAMPGNPMEAYLQNPSIAMNKEYVEELKRIFGIGLPLHEKYAKYMINMLTFNFGHTSPNFAGQKVTDIIFGIALPNTILLMGISSVLAYTIGIILGVFTAYKRGSKFDTFFVASALITSSLPTFWMGLIVQYIFGFTLKLFPIQGTYTVEKVAELSKNPILFWMDRFQYLVLPVMVITLYYYGGFLLLTRACLLEVISEDYMITAKAKGVKKRDMLFKHALKNASLPILTNIAMHFASVVIAGAMIAESVFNYCGLGTITYKAIGMKETPILQAIFYIISLCVIIANFIADILYGIIDPRVRYE